MNQLRSSVQFVFFLLCLALLGCGNTKITQQNFDRIKEGASLKECDELLGGKGELQGRVKTSGFVELPHVGRGDISVRAHTVWVPKESGEMYVWEDGAKIIVVTFLDGKVVRKAQSGL